MSPEKILTASTGAANRDPKLMDVLDIFLAFLCGEWKKTANRFQPGIKHPACHFAHGLIRGDPGNPLAVSWDSGWSCFEKLLFAHGGFLLGLAMGKAPSL